MSSADVWGSVPKRMAPAWWRWPRPPLPRAGADRQPHPLQRQPGGRRHPADIGYYGGLIAVAFGVLKPPVAAFIITELLRPRRSADVHREFGVTIGILTFNGNLTTEIAYQRLAPRQPAAQTLTARSRPSSQRQSSRGRPENEDPALSGWPFRAAHLRSLGSTRLLRINPDRFWAGPAAGIAPSIDSIDSVVTAQTPQMQAGMEQQYVQPLFVASKLELPSGRCWPRPAAPPETCLWLPATRSRRQVSP